MAFVYDRLASPLTHAESRAYWMQSLIQQEGFADMPQSSPPLPGKLREILKDYPEHIERLQEALNRSAERSRQVSLMPFDDAISALEGRLATFIIEARDELASAEASGDARAIADAAEKERLMLRARLQRQWIGDESIQAYFQGFEP